MYRIAKVSIQPIYRDTIQSPTVNQSTCVDHHSRLAPYPCLWPYCLLIGLHPDGFASVLCQTSLCALLALLVANLVIANLVITITSLYDLTI